MRIEKISAVTLTVGSMRNSVRFYRDVSGMEIIYQGMRAEGNDLHDNNCQA